MLDPLSALAVAAACVQFLDFAWKVVTQSDPIFNRSSSNAKKDELAQVVDHLRKLSAKLTESETANSQENGDISGISETCRHIEDELTNIVKPYLGKSKLELTEHAKSTRWLTVRQLIGSKSGDKKLLELERKLELLRQNLTLEILVELR